MSEMERAVAAVRAWSEGRGLREATLAEYRMRSPDTAEVLGVSLKEIRPVYAGQTLHFHGENDDPPGGVAFVRVRYRLELRRKPTRSFPAVGFFEVDYHLDGSLWSVKTHFENDLMLRAAELRRAAA